MEKKEKFIQGAVYVSRHPIGANYVWGSFASSQGDYIKLQRSEIVQRFDRETMTMQEKLSHRIDYINIALVEVRRVALLEICDSNWDLYKEEGGDTVYYLAKVRGAKSGIYGDLRYWQSKQKQRQESA